MAVTTLETLVDELIEKWHDVFETTEDRTEQTLADEVVDDLREVLRCLKR